MNVVLGINTNDYCPLPQFSHPRTESEYTQGPNSFTIHVSVHVLTISIHKF